MKRILENPLDFAMNLFGNPVKKDNSPKYFPFFTVVTLFHDFFC